MMKLEITANGADYSLLFDEYEIGDNKAIVAQNKETGKIRFLTWNLEGLIEDTVAIRDSTPLKVFESELARVGILSRFLLEWEVNGELVNIYELSEKAKKYYKEYEENKEMEWER